MTRLTRVIATLVTLATLTAGCASSSPAPEAIGHGDTPTTVSIPTATQTESASVAAPPTAGPVERELAMVDANADADVDIDGVGYAVDGASGRVEVVRNAENGAVSVDVPTELEGWPWAISAMSVEGFIGEAESLDSSMSTVVVPAAGVAGVVLSADGLDFLVPFTHLAAAAYSPTWEPASVMPRSGHWMLEMLVGAEYLSGPECASGGSAFVSIGDAQIATNSGGWSFTLIADGQYISAQRQALHTAIYVTGERPFPVQTANGSTLGVAVYQFEAVTPDRLEGTLTWDNNDGCSGTYPITVELEVPYDFIYDIPEPGLWQLETDLTSTCGMVTPMITHVDLDVTGGVGGQPALAHGGWLSLVVGENGNLASFGPLVLPGVTVLVAPATPPVTPVPVSAPVAVFGTIDMVAIAPGSYAGTFVGAPFGMPGCAVYGTVQFVRLG
jgi:hypothetical protein